MWIKCGLIVDYILIKNCGLWNCGLNLFVVKKCGLAANPHLKNCGLKNCGSKNCGLKIVD